MKLISTLLLSLLIVFSSASKKDRFEFTSKKENSIIFLVRSSSNGQNILKKVSKQDNEVVVSLISIESQNLKTFKDSLIHLGFENTLESKRLTRPEYNVLVNNFEYGYINQEKDSVFVYDLEFQILASGGRLITKVSPSYNTLYNLTGLKNNLISNDIFNSCIRYHRTNIKRLSVNIEKISGKPTLFASDSTVIDYNHSCLIYF